MSEAEVAYNAAMFACAKGSAVSTGAIVTETTIECQTPNFEKYGPVAVEVRVALDNGSMTNMALPCKFHTITKFEDTMAFGPGVLEGGMAEQKTVFMMFHKVYRLLRPRSST